MNEQDRNLLWNRVNAYVAARVINDGYPMYLPVLTPSPEVVGVEQAVMLIVERLYREGFPPLKVESSVNTQKVIDSATAKEVADKAGVEFMYNFNEALLKTELAVAKDEVERLTNNLVQTERHAQMIEQSLDDARTSLSNTQTALSRMMGERDEARRWMIRLTQQHRLPDLTREKDDLLQEVDRLRAELAFEKENSECVECSRERDETRVELTHCQKDFLDVSKQAERLLHENATLHKIINRIHGDVDKSEAERDGAREAVDKLREDRAALQAEITQLKELLVGLEKTSVESSREQDKKLQEALSDLEDAKAESERLEKLCGERTRARDTALAESTSLKSELSNIHKVIMKSADDWDRRLKQLERERDEARQAVEVAYQHVCLTDIGCGECHLCRTIQAEEQLSRELAEVREFLNSKGVPLMFEGVKLSTVDRIRIIFKSQDTLLGLLPDVQVAISALTKLSRGIEE